MDFDFAGHKAKVLKDPRSLDDLVRDALVEDDEISGRALVILHFKGSREVLNAVIQLSQSSEPTERSLAAVIVAQLGVPERTYPKESFDILASMLQVEKDEEVIATIASSFNFLDDNKKVELIAPLKRHANADVRYGVVKGLLTCTDTAAIDALIDLSHDEDSDVRDWATFGLGSQIDLDTPAIRDALLERIHDEDDDTRGEALVGLANRKDRRIVEALIDELTGEDVGLLSLEAARDLGDLRLVPALTELQRAWLENDDRHSKLVLEALNACLPEAGRVQ